MAAPTNPTQEVAMPSTPATITRAQWDSTHRDFRTGRPSDGTARVLVHDEATGATVLVPVEVAR